MQRPEAIHRVARECALDLAADGVVLRRGPLRPGTVDGARAADRGGRRGDGGRFRRGQRRGHRRREPDHRRRPAVRDAAGRPLGGGGRARRPLPGRRGGRLRPGRSRGRLPARPRARGDRPAGPGAGAPHDPRREAAGIESIRAALDGARAERLGHGVRIADEVGADGTLGPLARRVRDEQVPLEIAPTSNVQTGAYPSLAAHPVDRLHRSGFAVTVNTDNRLMSGVSATSELTDVAATFGWTWDDVADRHRAGRWRPRSSADDGPEAAARRGRPARLRRPSGLRGDGCHPALGNPSAIFAANLGVPAQRPVILPDGLSGHERIRADPAFHLLGADDRQ